MCGIVGYIGSRQATPILLESLEKLSYRGYDSAGIAVADTEGRISLRKAKGRVDNLAAMIQKLPVAGCVGIGHTRWATHGEPSDINAHPQTDERGEIAVVHNGIIENHAALRRYLTNLGVRFISQTDTEVVAHLLRHLYDGDMRRALVRAMGMLEGSFALGVITSEEPGCLFCARNDNPLIVGAKNGEGFIASDIPALLSHTRDVVFMEDKEIAILDTSGVQVYDAFGKSRNHSFFHVDWNLSDAGKGGYAHYMLKEIHEQPVALQSAIQPRLLDTAGETPLIEDQEAQMIKRVTIVACGTAYHAGLIGAAAIEKLARIPAIAEIASEFRYRDPVIGEHELFIAVSQSGETADTLAAMREAKRRGARVLAVCNTIGSTIAREADAMLCTYAGPEIAVASTKAYTTQLAVLLLLACQMGRARGALSSERTKEILEALRTLPQKAETALECENDMKRLASVLFQKKHVFFVGRGLDYALSMEAALKLKEVSYLFSEAYAAGELKHGPIALLQEGRLVVATVTQSALVDKVASNLSEAAARGARVIVICRESLREHLEEHAEELITIPNTDDLLSPILAAIPLQLFAYAMAVARGCDVDKPRNLAKSVTVE